MDKKELLTSIAKRGNGEIYLGVVGAVRTGKSTFIKRFIENLVVPNIYDDYEKKRCLDEIPQSAEGKMIMTTEPKFVPSNGAKIKVDDLEVNIKLVDCVGFVVPNALGYTEENGNPRMVKTPWFNDAVPFIEAAEIGTEKVIKDHATIGIVVTTDASFGSLKREDYLEAEEKVVNELKSIGKPFIIILNSNKPNAEETRALAESLANSYEVPTLPLNIEDMNESDILNVLKEALYEFPVMDIVFDIPEWISILPKTNEIKAHYIEKIKESTTSISKVRDASLILESFKDSPYINIAKISKLDTSEGIVHIKLDTSDELYNKVLESLVGDELKTKSGKLKVLLSYTEGKEETDSIKKAIKVAKKSGYGIVYPTLKDMRLKTPEVIKQGGRYGVKLKAEASSYHIVKVDVDSTFAPIIGTESQSKELIDYIMKDYETNPDSIWKSEIFGRSLDEIVKESIQGKLASFPENTRFKVGQTVTKIVNKGSNNFIAIVI